MSIESAREAGLRCVREVETDGRRLTEAFWAEFFDRLIDEAQAAMPCSHWLLQTCADFPQAEPRCPSCQARARLAAKEVPADPC